MAEGNAQVAFAQANTCKEDGIGLLFDEGKAEEVLDLQSIDLLWPAPNSLVLRGTRKNSLNSPIFSAITTVLSFLFGQNLA